MKELELRFSSHRKKVHQSPHGGKLPWQWNFNNGRQCEGDENLLGYRVQELGIGDPQAWDKKGTGRIKGQHGRP